LPSATFKIPLKPRQSGRVCRDNAHFFERVAQPTAKTVRINGNAVVHLPGINAVVHLPGMKTKQIKMDPELARAMKNQLSAFKKKFGREPGPNDPVFFDPDADTPQPIPIEKLRATTVIEAAKKTGTQTEFCEHLASTSKEGRHTLDAGISANTNRFQ